MNKKLEKIIKEALVSVGITDANFSLEHPGDKKMGDYSTNVAIKNGNKKGEIFKLIQDNLPKGVERVELVGPGFINFYLSKEFFKESLKEIIEKSDSFGKGEHAKGFKVMVEHTQPNPFKQLHIGHMMNNAIGESLARIIKWNGAEVKTASYHGDVGLHAAKAVWAMKKGEDFEKAYAAGSKAYDVSEGIKKEIQEINKKIYDRTDPEINDLYDAGRRTSIEQFESMYKRLGTKFDYSFYESESGGTGKELVLQNLGKIFEESEGAVIFKGENYGLHTRVFLNKDRLPTYEAKELGLAQIKSDLFSFDQSVTITANEQNDFFKVVEVAIGEVFPDLKGKLKHLSHGMLRLPGGKMSSRTGDVITAEELIDQVKGKVKDDEQVAIGAIKYMILRQGVGQDIVFDLEKSVSTEGDSGVYLQYAHARANSILEKAGKKGSASSESGEVREVEKLLYRFPEIIYRAGKDYAPNHIVTYLTELASAFNNFYAHEQVLDDSAESSYRLAVVEAFKIVMRNGLQVLGIPAPERM